MMNNELGKGREGKRKRERERRASVFAHINIPASDT